MNAEMNFISFHTANSGFTFGFFTGVTLFMDDLC